MATDFSKLAAYLSSRAGAFYIILILITTIGYVLPVEAYEPEAIRVVKEVCMNNIPPDSGRFYGERTSADYVSVTLKSLDPSDADIDWYYGYDPGQYYWIFAWNYEDSRSVTACFEVTLIWY